MNVHSMNDDLFIKFNPLTNMLNTGTKLKIGAKSKEFLLFNGNVVTFEDTRNVPKCSGECRQIV